MRAIEARRPLTAGALLGLWQAHREAYDDPLERTLRCNAAILQASCHADGEAVYRDEAEVLDDLTPREMERMLTLLAEGRQPERENPAFDSERFEALRGA